MDPSDIFQSLLASAVAPAASSGREGRRSAGCASEIQEMQHVPVQEEIAAGTRGGHLPVDTRDGSGREEQRRI
jgi:hypothetical protein